MTKAASLTVYCLCAAWCRTCDSYKKVFEDFGRDNAERANLVWVDIEDSNEAMEDVEVENFPSLLIAKAQEVYFFGPVVPYTPVLSRLVEQYSGSEAKPLNNQALRILNQRLMG